MHYCVALNLNKPSVLCILCAVFLRATPKALQSQEFGNSFWVSVQSYQGQHFQLWFRPRVTTFQGSTRLLFFAFPTQLNWQNILLNLCRCMKTQRLFFFFFYTPILQQFPIPAGFHPPHKGPISAWTNYPEQWVFGVNIMSLKLNSTLCSLFPGKSSCGGNVA